MMFVEILIGLLSPVVMYIIYSYVKQLSMLHLYPPGPIPYPVFGNVNLFLGTPHKNFQQLKENYGDVCSFSLVNQRAVVISDINVAREVLIQQGDKVSGRLRSSVIGFILNKRRNLLNSDGKRWKRLRKMAHSSLQLYGYGMDRIQSLIVQESEKFREKLRSIDGDPINPRTDLALYLMNVTCALMFGKRYEEGDSEFKQILQYHHLLKKAHAGKEAVLFMPVLRVLPIFKTVKWAHQAVAIRNPIFQQKIVEHYDSYIPGKIRDFIDSFIKYTMENDEKRSDIAVEDITFLLEDFLFGGVDTGLNSIGFAILYLVHHPEYQELVYQELNRVLDRSEYPSLEDRPRLPFLHATVLEVLRCSSIVNIGVPHRCLTSVRVGNYEVRKDTALFFNVWSINHDERYWQNPSKFDPWRWLDEDGTVKLGGQECFISFGLGRRNCVGETLAKAELFIFLGRLLKDFKLLPASVGILPPLEPDASLLLEPKPSKVRFDPRCR